MAPRHFFGSAEKRAQRQDTPAKRRIVPFHGGDQRGQGLDLRLGEEPLLTTEQVRVRLGLGSIDAVYRLVRDHELPRLTIGNLYRFSEPQVEAWIVRQQQANVQALGFSVRG